MFYSETYRFHQTVTGCGAVTRIHVNVLTPETFWTVVGVAVSFNSSTALCTDEIFDVALKFFVHRSVLIFSPCVSLSNVRFRLGDAVAARSKSQWF